MNMKNILILLAIFAAYAWVSDMDYQDALLAHGQNAAECETGKPAPDTEVREDA